MKIKCRGCGSMVERDKSPGFRDLCPSCSAYLHSCVHCRFHTGGRCTEPSAEKQRDPEGMNYCDYYEPLLFVEERGREEGRSEAEDLWKKLTGKS